MDLENKILEIIRNNISMIYEDVELTDDLELIKDLGFDSITLMQLVLELEETFGIEFNEDSDYNELNTILNFKEFVIKKINDK